MNLYERDWAAAAMRIEPMEKRKLLLSMKVPEYRSIGIIMNCRTGFKTNVMKDLRLILSEEQMFLTNFHGQRAITQLAHVRSN